MSALPDTPVSPAMPHPAPCPPWCRDRHRLAAHHVGPTATAHWSPQYRLANLAPLSADADVVLRAELFRLDEHAAVGRSVLYVQGESDVELGPDEADIFVVQMQAFVDALRVLRRQMG